MSSPTIGSKLDKTAVKASSFSTSLSLVIGTLTRVVGLKGTNVTSTEVPV